MEASEFFNEIVSYLGRIVNSFNKNEFPDKTLNLIGDICNFIEKEKNLEMNGWVKMNLVNLSRL